jgi:hypothetical protein
MGRREFFIHLSDGAVLRVWYTKEHGHILRFLVQLEAYLDEEWTPISRYDNAHRFVHRDDLKPDGSQIKTPPMAFANNEEALNYAIYDLRVNHPLYIERFLQWKVS